MFSLLFLSCNAYSEPEIITLEKRAEMNALIEAQKNGYAIIEPEETHQPVVVPVPVVPVVPEEFHVPVPTEQTQPLLVGILKSSDISISKIKYKGTVSRFTIGSYVPPYYRITEILVDSIYLVCLEPGKDACKSGHIYMTTTAAARNTGLFEKTDTLLK